MLRRINVQALGLALGFTWGIGVFALGLIASFGYGIEFVEFVSKFYLGYKATLVGSLTGFLWASVNAYICGVVIAWFYNKFSSMS
jgi:hypothetical protein